MQTVVLTGSRSPLGRRVRVLLRDDPDVDRVIELDQAQLQPEALIELKRHVEGATGLIHLDEDAPATRAVLEAVAAAGARHAVILSTTMVYGASSANPVPLTEEAPVRPNPELGYAIRAAERERLAAEWVAAHPDATVAILRSAVPVAEDDEGALARALRAAAGPLDAGDDAPVQFVHHADLATALDLARRRRLSGPYNVAPDGWIGGDALRSLAGGPRVRLPDLIATRVATLRWRLLLTPERPGLTPYARHPWVAANDRLKAEGWTPRYTNEEAYVAAAPGGPLATISPGRRQQLALGGAAIGAVAVAAAAIGVGRWATRRRRRSA